MYEVFPSKVDSIFQNYSARFNFIAGSIFFRKIKQVYTLVNFNNNFMEWIGYDRRSSYQWTI